MNNFWLCVLTFLFPSLDGIGPRFVRSDTIRNEANQRITKSAQVPQTLSRQGLYSFLRSLVCGA